MSTAAHRISRRPGLRAPAAGLALAGLLLGCVAPVVPAGGELTLDDDEGFLVVHVYTRWPLRRLTAEFHTLAMDIPPGEQLRLVRLPAGRYRWSEAVFQRDAPYYKLSMYRTEGWEFEVRPGVINYPGSLWVGESHLHGGMGSASARSVNRSSYVLAPLLVQFPEALRRHEIVFTGYVRDDFLEVYRRELLERHGDPAGGRTR